jgi:DNA-binding SARP family transcriptional activator
MPTTSPRRLTPIRFRILGTIEFLDEARWSSIGAAKQRALLATLLLNANQVVPADRLVGELWPDKTPASANGLLAGYVWRLRGLLHDGAGDILATRPPGYQLNLARGTLDVHEYERLVMAGRAGLAAHDPAAAAKSFAAALALWRGAPLADVAPTAAVMAEVARLEESRLAVVEARIGAELELGQHDGLLPELKLMVSQHPLRERLHAHLMLTLYRCGQQAEALGTYHDLRRLLINELGIEPSKPLRELQRRILHEDPTLMVAMADPKPETVQVTARPRTLPPDNHVFAGRSGELSATTGQLLRGGVCAVYGPPGTGKTALALRAAHDTSGHFTDGQLWLDLRGSTGQEPSSPDELIGALLGSFGVEPAAGQPGPDAALARWAAVMAGRRVLVVLDDVPGIEAVRPFLSPPTGCTVLLTGRAAPPGLGVQHRVRLGRLPAVASVDLLRQLLGPGRVDTDPAGAAAIAQLCEYLPLALRIVATRLAMRPEWTLEDFALRLADPRRRLDLLTVGEHSVRDSVGASLRLTEGDPDARTALHLLGALDLPVVSVATIAALLDSSEQAAHLVAERLVDLGLIDTLTIDRYRVPDLVRLLAREQQDGTADAPAAVGRVVDHYVELVRERLFRHRERASPGSIGADLAWYRRELGTLRSLVDRDHTDQLHKVVDELRWALSGNTRMAARC